MLLRLSPEVHDALRVWAKQEQRSMNGQVAYVLSRALRDERRDRHEGEFGPGRLRGRLEGVDDDSGLSAQQAPSGS